MDAQRARELLAKERARVEALLAAAHDEPGDPTPADQHPADDASNLADRELDAGLEEHLREELAAVERAERRLAEGTYGRSVESGEPIPDARLEVHPTAERTVAEEERRNRR